jgi:hypothetical protein
MFLWAASGLTGDEKGSNAFLALASGKMPFPPYSQESK